MESDIRERILRPCAAARPRYGVIREKSFSLRRLFTLENLANPSVYVLARAARVASVRWEFADGVYTVVIAAMHSANGLRPRTPSLFLFLFFPFLPGSSFSFSHALSIHLSLSLSLFLSVRTYTRISPVRNFTVSDGERGPALLIAPIIRVNQHPRG